MKTDNGRRYQHEFASRFNAPEIADKILKTDNPYEVKKLSRGVLADKKLWHRFAPEIMKTGLINKYAQNEHHLNALLATDNKKLGEAGNDRFWGTGVSLILTVFMKRKNTLGKLLADVRKQFQG